MAVATEREYGLFIDGQVAEPAGGEPKELTEPATGEPLARVAMAAEADVDRAVEAARAALDGDWGRTPPTERSRLLHALADALVANRKELAQELGFTGDTNDSATMNTWLHKRVMQELEKNGGKVPASLVA